MNVALAAVRTRLADKKSDFFLCPLFIPRQSGQGEALETARFGLSLGPGANFLLYEEVSTGPSFV